MLIWAIVEVYDTTAVLWTCDHNIGVYCGPPTVHGLRPFEKVQLRGSLLMIWWVLPVERPENWSCKINLGSGNLKTVTEYSVLQPPRNKMFNLFQKDQILEPRKLKVLPLATLGRKCHDSRVVPRKEADLNRWPGPISLRNHERSTHASNTDCIPDVEQHEKMDYFLRPAISFVFGNPASQTPAFWMLRCLSWSLQCAGSIFSNMSIWHHAASSHYCGARLRCRHSWQRSRDKLTSWYRQILWCQIKPALGTNSPRCSPPNARLPLPCALLHRTEWACLQSHSCPMLTTSRTMQSLNFWRKVYHF